MPVPRKRRVVEVPVPLDPFPTRPRLDLAAVDAVVGRIDACLAQNSTHDAETRPAARTDEEMFA